MILPRLLYGAWLTAARRHHTQLRRALANPEAAQQRLLRRILRDNAESRAGQRHGFAAIDSPSAFRRRLPLVRYDDLREELEAIRCGEPRVLTAAPVERLLPSGGSTGGAKLLPFTRALGRDFARGVGAWMVDLAGSYPGIRSGPAYWSVSPAFDGPAVDSRLPVGFDDDASYLGRWLAPLVSRTLVAPAALRRARPLESFQYATLRLLVAARELRLISVWHPSFLEILLDGRGEVWDRLVEDVAAGRLSPPAPLDEAVQRSLETGLRRDPKRAAELRALGPEAPAHLLWPRLAVVSAWGDGAAHAPCEALRRRLAPVAVQPKGLVATEAFISLPLGGGYPPALTSTYVELLDEAGETRGVAEARQGAEYELVLTTAGGLYRYRLGDVVRVEGRVGATPSLRLVGRADRVVDRVGEKLSEVFAATAIARAYDGEPQPAFAMLAPEGGSYALFVDRTPAAPEAVLGRLRAALRVNPHFAYAQDLGQLGPLRLVRVAPDAARRFLAHRHATGQDLGSIKATALADEAPWSEILGGEVVG